MSHPFPPAPSACYDRRVRPLLLTLLLPACGYQLLGPDRGGVASLRLGEINDLGAEGDLGLQAGRLLREALAGRARPRLGRGPLLVGEVRPLAQEPVSWSEGSASAWRTGVQLELRLQRADEVLWASGPLLRRAIYLKGSTPLESLGSRREARRRALRLAVEAALDHLLATPIASEAS